MTASRLSLVGLALGLISICLLPLADPLSYSEPLKGSVQGRRFESGPRWELGQDFECVRHSGWALSSSTAISIPRINHTAKAATCTFALRPRASSSDLAASSQANGLEVAGQTEGKASANPVREPDGTRTVTYIEEEPGNELRKAELKLVNVLAADTISADTISTDDEQSPRESGLRQPKLGELTMFASWTDGDETDDAGPRLAEVSHTSMEPEPDPISSGLEEEAYRVRNRPDRRSLLDPSFLRDRGIRLGGWIDQGLSVVANMPADRFNGPVTFNDRDGEYQMNQFWLFAEREIENGGSGWDVGGRVDLVYGTDARFTQTVDGLESDWNQTERFYQVALPQLYLDVAYNDLTVRMGHFFTTIGYEVVPAPENFFYSHAYTMQYGEPFTHTGILAMYDLNDRLSFSAGLHRGNDQFDDTDGLDSLGFLGGVGWTNYDENLSINFAISASEDGPGVDTTIYSLVGTCRLTEKLNYVIQHDYGRQNVYQQGGADWYGINQYLFYDINNRWDAGLRVEWFRDANGVRVTPNTAPGVPPGLAGNFYELTAGLNWKPHANVSVRPEARWDWHDGAGLPYDTGNRNNQFLFGCDLICTF